MIILPNEYNIDIWYEQWNKRTLLLWLKFQLARLSTQNHIKGAIFNTLHHKNSWLCVIYRARSAYRQCDVGRVPKKYGFVQTCRWLRKPMHCNLALRQYGDSNDPQWYILIKNNCWTYNDPPEYNISHKTSPKLRRALSLLYHKIVMKADHYLCIIRIHQGTCSIKERLVIELLHMRVIYLYMNRYASFWIVQWCYLYLLCNNCVIGVLWRRTILFCISTG